MDRWLVLTVELPPGTNGADVADVLIAAGGRGAEERDDTLVTYVPAVDDPEALARAVRARVAERLGHDSPVRVTWSWKAQQDWAELWKRGLGARRVTDRIVVHPSWLEPQAEPGDIVIQLDPGMAFGTAEHGTTRGCLRALDLLGIRDGTVLDVGAGSGILSICAALLGATHVLAVDSDPLACDAARENVERNRVASVVEVVLRDVTDPWLRDLAPRDGVIANLDSGSLRPLLPGLASAVAHGGWLVVSGLLGDERETVEREAPSELELVDDHVDEGWWSLSFVRR